MNRKIVLYLLVASLLKIIPAQALAQTHTVEYVAHAGTAIPQSYLSRLGRELTQNMYVDMVKEAIYA